MSKADSGIIETVEIKVLNKVTGEMNDFVVANIVDARKSLLEINASISAQKKATDQLKSYIDNCMGEDDEYHFMDGGIARRKQREVRTWTVDGLKEIGLDQDAIDVVSKINMTAARALIDEMIDRGDIAPNSKKLLQESAEVSVSQPFIEVK